MDDLRDNVSSVKTLEVYTRAEWLDAKEVGCVKD